MKRGYFILMLSILLMGCNNKKENNIEKIIIDPPLEDLDGGEAGREEGLFINPISHASMVLQWDNSIIYVDPVGDKNLYSSYSAPDLILITDIHSDHFDVNTIQAIIKQQTNLIVPQTVFDSLPKELKTNAEILHNNENIKFSDLEIEAIPMYNLREEALKFHPKGRGNGYVLENKNRRVYISGDTEDIPEMRSLKNIDIAFICMNLPYTMSIEQAANAVLAFKPKTVYPYHYRGENGISDVGKFEALIRAKNPDIKVTELNWYPKE